MQNKEQMFTVHELLDKYKRHEGDSGSPEVQIIMLSYRISYLTRHLNEFAKDFSAKKSITMLVNKRRKNIKYLATQNVQTAKNIVQDIGIRYNFA